MAFKTPVCIVPSSEVIALTAELQALGSSDIAVGRGFGTCVVPSDGGAAAAEAVPGGQAFEVFRVHDEACRRLGKVLGDWLVQGFCSTVVLWGLPSGPILGAIVAVWLQGDRGCKLGLSWMLVGPTLQPPGPRPSSRLGPRSSSSTSAWSDQHQQRQPTVGISSLEQALEVVTVAQQQQQRLECQGGRHLLLTLHLEGHGTSGPAMTISILDLAAGPAQQREQALKLLHEVATLHMRKCAGDYVLATAGLSLLNDHLARLVLGSRLFFAADLSQLPSTSNKDTVALLEAVCHVNTVCSKQVSGGVVLQGQQQPQEAGQWLLFQEFSQQRAEEAEAAKQLQDAAAGRAAAEAARREALKADRLTPAWPQSAPAVTAGSSRGCTARHLPRGRQRQQETEEEEDSKRDQQQQPEGEPQQWQEQQADGKRQLREQQQQAEQAAQRQRGQQQEQEHLRYVAQLYCSPTKSPRARQQQQHTGEPVAEPSSAAASPAGGTSAGLHEQQLVASSLGGQQTGSGQLDRLRQEFQSLYQQAVAREQRSSVGPSQAGAHPGMPPPADGLAVSASQVADDVALNAARVRIQQQLLHEECSWEAPPDAGLSPVFELSASSQQVGSQLGHALAAVRAQAAGMCAGTSEQQQSQQQSQKSEEEEEQQQQAPPSVSAWNWPVWRQQTASAYQEASDAFNTENLARFEGQLQPDWHQQQSGGTDQASLPSQPHLESTASTVKAGATSLDRAAPLCRSSSGSYARQPQQLPHQQRLPTASGQEQETPPSYAAASGRQRYAAAATPLSSQGARPPADSGTQRQQQPPAELGMPTLAEPAAGAEAMAIQAAAAQAAAALAELQREQLANSEFLRQLHQLQQQVQELAGAAAAAAQPALPGVEDPADFNGLLAALQQERRNGQVLQQRLMLVEQGAGEEVAQLEVQLCTMQRQLAVARARCMAWERREPLAAAFQRYEDEMARLESEAGELRQENQTLARLLAEADLVALSQAAGPLPDDAASVCRALHSKLKAAQAQARRLGEDKAGLQRAMQGLQRRDRLAALARRQADEHLRRAEEAQARLAQRERQLEQQCLAAAASAARAEVLEDRLATAERELAGAGAQNEGLQEANDSLRKQVHLLRAQLSREGVLKHIQVGAQRAAV